MRESAEREQIEREINNLLIDTFNGVNKLEQNAIKNGRLKNLTITEVHIIEAIGDEAKQSMSQIAAKLGVAVATLTTAVDKLVAKGYVDRNRSAEDRRIVHVALTRTGHIALRMHRLYHARIIKAALEGVDDESRRLLLDMLGRLNHFFRSDGMLKIKWEDKE